MSRLTDKLYTVQKVRHCDFFSLDNFVDYETRKVDRDGLTDFLIDAFTGISEGVSSKEETVARCVGVGAAESRLGAKFPCIDNIPNIVSRRDLITWFKNCHLEVVRYGKEKARKRSRTIRGGCVDREKDFSRPSTNRSRRAD